MGYEIQFTAPGEMTDILDLGSSQDWEDFSTWATALKRDLYPSLVAFGQDGRVTGTDDLAKQLKQALAKQKPENRGARLTAQHLLKLIGIGDPHETASITDGVNDGE